MIVRRDQVLCVAVSENLRHELQARGLAIVEQDWTADLLAPLIDGKTRLIGIAMGAADLTKHPRNERQLYSQLQKLAPYAARDSLLLLVDPGIDRADRARAGQLMLQAMGEYRDTRRTETSIFPPARQAQRFLSHKPGPHWADVELNQAVGTELEADQILLIQRAVSDAARASVRRLDTKKNIFRVDAEMIDEPNRHPFLVKFIPRGSRADREIGNYRNICEETIPYFSLPPLAESRCVRGLKSDCLVFHFADHAITLADSMRTRSPSRAIAALFDSALRQWRAAGTQEEVAVGASLFEQEIIDSNPAKYADSYGQTQQDGSRQPNAIIDAIRKYPKRSMRICMSHGDLHVRNVLINEGAEEVSLIDFFRSRKAPATIDPAELEVSIAFAQIEGVDDLSENEARALYSPDIFTEHMPLGRAASKRALGIQQVRRQVACEVNAADYAITLAASLLYYARKSVTAYRAADRLSQVQPC